MSAELLRAAAQAMRIDASALDEDRAWYPAVALAVADWLDNTALRLESYVDTFPPGSRAGLMTSIENTQGLDQALRVARAYLGAT